jgi:hypothetical protein
MLSGPLLLTATLAFATPLAVTAPTYAGTAGAGTTGGSTTGGSTTGGSTTGASTTGASTTGGGTTGGNTTSAGPHADAFVVGHATMASGVAFAALATAFFVDGSRVEAALRAQARPRAEVDALLVRRTIDAAVAWPAAALATACISAGALVLALAPSTPEEP